MILTKPKYYIGIDPGIYGAIAVLTEDSVIALHKMPKKSGNRSKNTIDDQGVKHILEEYPIDDTVVMIEDQWARGTDGVKSACSLGYNFGKLITVIKSLQLIYYRKDPKHWQEDSIGSNLDILLFKFGSEFSDLGPKDKSLKAANLLAPLSNSQKEFIGDDDGLSDAVLIALSGVYNYR